MQHYFKISWLFLDKAISLIFPSFPESGNPVENFVKISSKLWKPLGWISRKFSANFRKFCGNIWRKWDVNSENVRSNFTKFMNKIQEIFFLILWKLENFLGRDCNFFLPDTFRWLFTFRRPIFFNFPWPFWTRLIAFETNLEHYFWERKWRNNITSNFPDFSRFSRKWLPCKKFCKNFGGNFEEILFKLGK